MDIPLNDGPGPLSPLEAMAASVTLKDHELLAAGPCREKTETVHDLVLLGFIGLFEFGLWTVAFATFGVPLAAAVPSALLIGAIIVAIDVRMTSSDTLPRGVLGRVGCRGRSSAFSRPGS